MKKDKIMAKSCIVYFSQTGNTEKVAYTIAGRLQGEGFEHVTLQLEDAHDFPEAYVDADILGVGFPTFFGYPPPHVMKFIESLEGNGKHAFVFTTYGGCTAGDSLYDAARALHERGFAILGGLKVEGFDNYPQSIWLKINEGRPNELDLARSEEFAALAIKAYREGRSLSPEALATSNLFFVKKRDKPRKETMAAMRKKIEGKVVFNKEMCLFCETCKKSCPTKSITTGEAFPEFSWKCIDGVRCFQCVRVCPGKALLYEQPISDKEYKRFLKGIADSPEEKARPYVVA
ncbi:EFR1 family ferrodoxin [Methanocella conradii]|uniref:EFR1 family ferrodoxin n=1 Tax=Methanocella conradii TaxID=1175444 RepID=UPI0024B37DD9|nr:EFR1 family ferrodoxin [Methanocella conradii]MDI6898033.1 EFR1 family ferrodoxin [Methanocella conradii]